MIKGYMLKRDIGKFESDEEITLYLKKHTFPVIPVVVFEVKQVEEVKGNIKKIIHLTGFGGDNIYFNRIMSILEGWE